MIATLLDIISIRINGMELLLQKIISTGTETALFPIERNNFIKEL
jgi:hypothetical protein